MLPLWQIILLAVVQGVAEFLPISSSGHTVILATLFAQFGNAKELDIAELNVVLHLGTLFSIVVVYWQTLLKLLKENRRLFPLILLGTLPAVLIGLPIRLFASEVLENALLAGCMLMVTGLILLAVSKLTNGKRELEAISWIDASVIGFSQAFALLPGISRSGTTICTAMARGLTPATAATFSFLLALPVIGGAGVFEMLKLSRDVGGRDTPGLHLLLGAVVSFAVGVVSLKFLLRVLSGGKLGWFALWCIPVGFAVMVWQILG